MNNGDSKSKTNRFGKQETFMPEAIRDGLVQSGKEGRVSVCNEKPLGCLSPE